MAGLTCSNPSPLHRSIFRVEAAYAAAAGALHLEDIMIAADADLHRVSAPWGRLRPQLAEIVAPILGWTQNDIDTEVDTYIAGWKTEVRSQTQPDDESADALRGRHRRRGRRFSEQVPLT